MQCPVSSVVDRCFGLPTHFACLTHRLRPLMVAVDATALRHQLLVLLGHHVWSPLTLSDLNQSASRLFAQRGRDREREPFAAVFGKRRRRIRSCLFSVLFWFFFFFCGVFVFGSSANALRLSATQSQRHCWLAQKSSDTHTHVTHTHTHRQPQRNGAKF